jgi:uncharacterized protein DUF1236
MRKSLLFASLVGLTLVPPLAFADTVVVEPEVDTWVMDQPDSGITVDGDVVVGTPLPGSVQVIEVPNYDSYGYVVVNKRRVLVDRKSHKVVKIYE